jgi:hypothetical protein
MKAVAGIFVSGADARHAAERLGALGISESRISLLRPGASESELGAVPTTEGESPGTGKALGGVVGGAVGAAGGLPLGAVMASLVIPGIGPVIASGLVAAAIAGAGGAAIGGALENAMTEGLPKDELFLYEDALRHGRSVLIVLTTDEAEADRVRDALSAAGAESVDAARERWWIGLRGGEEAAYRAEGRDFTPDERDFRQGFEAALERKARGRPLEEALDEISTRYPDVPVAPAFRRGYERGQAYLRSIDPRPDEGPLRRSA